MVTIEEMENYIKNLNEEKKKAVENKKKETVTHVTCNIEGHHHWGSKEG